MCSLDQIVAAGKQVGEGSSRGVPHASSARSHDAGCFLARLLAHLYPWTARCSIQLYFPPGRIVTHRCCRPATPLPLLQDGTITKKNSPARNVHRLLNTLNFIAAIFQNLAKGMALKVGPPAGHGQGARPPPAYGGAAGRPDAGQSAAVVCAAPQRKAACRVSLARSMVKTSCACGIPPRRTPSPTPTTARWRRSTPGWCAPALRRA